MALAQFKTKHGWEDLTLDIIEPKVEEERRLRFMQWSQLGEMGDVLSDSSSTSAELPYPSRTLMSSPLKASGPIFSDAIVSKSGGTGGHRKRSYIASFDKSAPSPSKRFRLSPTSHRSFPSGHAADTFAFATALERHLGWKGAVPAYIFSSYVAISRLHDNRHYASDVAFGAALGIVVGRSVTFHGRNFYASPMWLSDGGGIQLALAN